MPAYNFQARFVPAVMSGAKVCTIRRREAKVGSVAYLFTGMRTKSCERLGRGEIVDCRPITLGYQQNGMPRAMLGRQKMTQKDLLELAVSDGFSSAREMVTWFESTYSSIGFVADSGRDIFCGFLISWVLEE